ncbi:diacylglycerol kinase family protein [Aquisediminimonas profunda]|uniref:diacylglycerol kinase family protein n=1 Tax=Aquisediminimonas profunda TaxID=1550733 RepID=UPI001C62A9F7|nr:diacylglycerol kinase family protein [Aquisediminimonas profunda]
MVAVALLSNPRSTGNRDMLPRIRAFCAGRPDMFHYEVEHVSQIADALESIARVRPKVLVINGGDGTVQATLTELYNGGQFGREVPPVAVLPNGKTNLIALDLGSSGDPLVALERIAMLAKSDLRPHVVERELIALTEGETAINRPVLGMFLGGAGLADTILFCRNKIYPLGLPNGVSHVLAGILVLFSAIFGVRGKYLPPAPQPVRVSLIREGQSSQRFAFLIVTTLEKMLLGGKSGGRASGLKLMAVDQSPLALLKALIASIRGQLGDRPVVGVHVEQGDVIRIESERSSVILDGEEFHALKGRPIVLRSTPPVSFLRLAA